MPHGRFAWYQLATTDTDAARAFYEGLLSWSSRVVAMPDFSYIVLAAEGSDMGGVMPLMPEQAQAGVPPHWAGFVEVDDVDATVKKASELGGAVFAQPADVPGVGRFAVIADPQGAMLALFHWIEGLSPPVTPRGTMGAVGWHELAATDWEAVFPFYAALFGWTKGEPVDMGPMGIYQLFDHDGQSIGGMFNRPPEMPAPFWLYYAKVPSIDAAIAVIKDCGGKILNGPMEVPGGAFIVQAMDPQGAMFAVVAPPAGATGCGDATAA
ncbi:glyoxalase [Azorhizobium oxalatiphilum]|uniref:Glyoxalase n=1 Tax=Azorhizobium oxalatiphilum TaxID=980631 RepID=A0A917F913_9HYPH|nr:VOC family protein [Azorhizobium oxalatiphilum]GGF61294.1 glyoxalase [Azorhizobium oxalatiphilum]